MGVKKNLPMPSRNTAEILRTLQDLYNDLDDDGDGLLTEDEIKMYLAKNSNNSDMSAKVAEIVTSFLGRLDRDNDKKISFEEFRKALDIEVGPLLEEHENRDMFDMFCGGNAKASYLLWRHCIEHWQHIGPRMSQRSVWRTVE